jgi:hypothetical protein
MAIATVGVALAARHGLRGPAVYLALDASLAGVGAPPSLPDDTASLLVRAVVASGRALASPWSGPTPAAAHRLRPVRRLHLGAPPGRAVRGAARPGDVAGRDALAWSRADRQLLTILVVVRPTSSETGRRPARLPRRRDLKHPRRPGRLHLLAAAPAVSVSTAVPALLLTAGAHAR